mgnify:CR=1 FL=1
MDKISGRWSCTRMNLMGLLGWRRNWFRRMLRIEDMESRSKKMEWIGRAMLKCMLEHYWKLLFNISMVVLLALYKILLIYFVLSFIETKITDKKILIKLMKKTIDIITTMYNLASQS